LQTVSTKIYNKIGSDENTTNLQSDLCNLVSWSKEWQMLVNAMFRNAK